MTAAIGLFDDQLYDPNCTLFTDKILENNQKILQIIGNFVVISDDSIINAQKITKTALGGNIMNLVLFPEDTSPVKIDETVGYAINHLVAENPDISVESLKMIYFAALMSDEFILCPDEDDLYTLINHIYDMFKVDYYLKNIGSFKASEAVHIHIDINTWTADLTSLPTKESFYNDDTYLHIFMFYLSKCTNIDISFSEHGVMKRLVGQSSNKKRIVFQDKKYSTIQSESYHRFTESFTMEVKQSVRVTYHSIGPEDDSIALDELKVFDPAQLTLQRYTFPISFIFDTSDKNLKRIEGKNILTNKALTLVYYEPSESNEEKFKFIDSGFTIIYNNQIKHSPFLLYPSTMELLTRPLYDREFKVDDMPLQPTMAVLVTKSIPTFGTDASTYTYVVFNTGNLLDTLSFFDLSNITGEKSPFYEKDLAAYIYNHRRTFQLDLHDWPLKDILDSEYVKNPLLLNSDKIIDFLNAYFNIDLQIHNLSSDQRAPAPTIGHLLRTNSYQRSILDNQHLPQYQKLVHAAIELFALQETSAFTHIWATEEGETSRLVQNVSLFRQLATRQNPSDKYYIICKPDPYTGFLKAH